MAYGGTPGDALFVNTIAASPYLPLQYGYKDWAPTQSYYAFALLAGCADTTAYGSSSQAIFECLVAKDSATLVNASATISESGNYGTWGFLPVTDGVFTQQTPSQQMLQKKVNGKNALVGNNADEGAYFVVQNITTEADLVAWIQVTFPLFTNDDIAQNFSSTIPAQMHPSTPARHCSPHPADVGPTAINQSDVSTGQ